MQIVLSLQNFSRHTKPVIFVISMYLQFSQLLAAITIWLQFKKNECYECTLDLNIYIHMFLVNIRLTVYFIKIFKASREY